MSSPINFSRAISALCSVVLFSFAQTGSATVLLGFSDGDGSVSVAPGSAFQFSVYLTVTNPSEVVGFDYYLLGSGTDYEGDFAIVSRASNLSLFSELNTTDPAVASPFVDAILSPMNARSLGAFVSDLDAPVAVPGTYLVATFEIGVSAFAPVGTYSISSASSSWIDQDFVEHAFDGEGSFVVNVVPEPSSAVLVIFGLGAFFQRRRQRQIRTVQRTRRLLEMPSATEVLPPSGATSALAIESYYFGRWMAGERIARKKILTLRNEEIRPAIRLAHRRGGTLNFRKRIIFDHMLFFVVSGKACWNFRERVVEAAPGHLLFMPPFEPHSSQTGERAGCEHIAIHFDWRPSLPGDGLSGSGRSPYRIALPEGWRIPAVQMLSKYDRLPGIFERIVNLKSRAGGLSGLHADALLFDVLMDLIKRNQEEVSFAPGQSQDPDRVRIEAALLLMERSLAAPLNVAQLAEAAGMSPSWFSHVFRASMGRPPMEHLAALRLDHARSLLCESRLSIKEVAVRCGFPDPYHFSKVFSRLEGVPPSEYRVKMPR